MRLKIKRKNPVDFWLLIITAGLVVFGVIMVFSASYYQSINEDGNPYAYLIRAGGWAVIGFIAMLVMATIDYRNYVKYKWFILGGSFVLLALVFTPLGVTLNGATRWIGLGPIPMTIMPGEIAKLAAIIFVAVFFGENPERIKSLKNGILPMVVLCGAYGVMIMLQPNMSTAFTLVGIVVLMMVVAGLNMKWFCGLGVAGLVGMAVLIFADDGGYRLKRVTSFMNPFEDSLGSGFQVVQSLMALGSGGLFGVGLGKSIQKNLYLPEPQNDFILAIIGEELGFIGVMVLMAAYVFLLWRGIHIAINAPDHLGVLLASGVVIMIALQVIFNVAVVTSSMPPTGVILPFVSYGGNAQLIFMMSIGILLNVSRHTVKVK